MAFMPRPRRRGHRRSSRRDMGLEGRRPRAVASNVFMLRSGRHGRDFTIVGIDQRQGGARHQLHAGSVRLSGRNASFGKDAIGWITPSVHLARGCRWCCKGHRWDVRQLHHRNLADTEDAYLAGIPSSNSANIALIVRSWSSAAGVRHHPAVRRQHHGAVRSASACRSWPLLAVGFSGRPLCAMVLGVIRVRLPGVLVRSSRWPWRSWRSSPLGSVLSIVSMSATLFVARVGIALLLGVGCLTALGRAPHRRRCAGRALTAVRVMIRSPGGSGGSG